jgi:cell division protein FtsW
MNFQPSELMKFVAVLLAAHYTIRRQEHLHSLVKGFLPLGIIVGIVGGLLLWEPDMGAFMVSALLLPWAFYLLGGINAKLFGYLILVGIGLFGLIVATSQFRRDGIIRFLKSLD